MPDAAKSIVTSTGSVTTMLNMNGTTVTTNTANNNGQNNNNNNDNQMNGTTVQSIYDFYKIPVVVDGVSKGITLITSDGKSVVNASACDAQTLQEMVWSAVPVSAVSTADVLQNATIVATTSPNNNNNNNNNNNRHSDEEKLSSPINGHHSPQQHVNVKIEKNHLILTTTAVSGETTLVNGDGITNNNNNNNGQQTIIVATSQPPAPPTGQVLHGGGSGVAEVHIKSEPITTVLPLTAAATHQQHQNDIVRIKNEPINQATLLQQQHVNEVHIKSEPLDSLPPLASPAQMVDVIPATSGDHSRELEPSPPATVISLAPAQPYPPNATTQLTFATPTYDISGNGQYAVQVNASAVAPQYAVSSTNRATNGGGGTVYLTTDYITYREYYPNATNGQQQPQQQQQQILLSNNNDQFHAVRQHLTTTSTPTATAAVIANSYSNNNNSNNNNNQNNNNSNAETESSFLDRYLRQQQQQQQPVTTASIAGTIVPTTVQASAQAVAAVAASIASNGVTGYKSTTIHGLTVDLPSPDSGIGDTTATPRPENAALPQIFEYTTGLSAQTAATATILPVNATTTVNNVVVTTAATPQQANNNNNILTPNTPNVTPAAVTKSSSRRSWHEYGRNSDIDKIQIPKLFSDTGFKYYLESPISTSQRREDDRVTYINKGQFYGITLEFINDPDKPLKNATVKSIIMLVFREEKTQDEEVKAWQFWHSRQHSVKQRILDADTKNSSGIVGPIEEVAHNAIAFYWNPMDGPAKVNIAVQCLSTDFSNQKGVKGLPLHLQVDTFDDIREGSTPVHRGYCQIKVFCDKGAERKTRDEERRAAKRKMNATGNGRKKIEEMYHPSCDRSEFYSMSDLMKPPVLFTPSEDIDKITTGDINFYGHNTTDIGYDTDSAQLPSISTPMPITTIHPCERTESLVCEMPIPCPPKKIKLERYPSLNDRVLLFAKQENEDVFHPLHLVPPTLVGLALAIENKYKLEAKNIRNIYRRCKKGITVQMDDDMVKHYSHEDTVLLEVHQIDAETHDITLVEYIS